MKTVRWVRSSIAHSEAGRLYGLYGGRIQLQGVGTLHVIKTALDFKSRGQSIKLLILDLKLAKVADVSCVIELLVAAKICIDDGERESCS